MKTHNTTKLPQPIFELIQTLLDVRSQMEDVYLDAGSLAPQYTDARSVSIAAESILSEIDLVLDLVHYGD